MTARPKSPAAPRRAQQHIAYVMPPSSPDPTMAVLETKVDALVRQTNETNETLRSLTRAVTQLAVIEERQTADRQAVDRAFSEINLVKAQLSSMDKNVDDRLKFLEKKSPINDISNSVIAKITWLVISAVVGAILVLVIARPSTQTPVFIQQAPAQHQIKPLPR